MPAVAQGSAHITVVLDVCYERNSINLQRVSDALTPLNPQLARAGFSFVLDAATLKSGLNFTLITDSGDIDLLGEASGLGFYEQVKKQAEEVEVFGHQLWVLTIEGLNAPAESRREITKE